VTDHPEQPGESFPERWTAATVYLDMWVNPDEDPRDSGTELVDERSTLVEYLRRYRLTLEMKCSGLDAEQMARRSVPPSNMSLLGLVRHLADDERHWFRRVMAGEDAPARYRTATDRDADFNGARANPQDVAEAWASWRDERAFAERLVAQTPDLATAGHMPDGSPIQLRVVLVHRIEEYARHCGHADLIRERIDGRVGQ